MGKLKGKFIVAKVNKVAVVVAEAGLADNNMVIVMSPIEGSSSVPGLAIRKKADLKVGSVASALGFGTDISGNMNAHRARPPQNPTPELILSRFPAAYLGMFAVSVCDNGTTIAFTPCSQGLMNYVVNEHELFIHTKINKDEIQKMYFEKDGSFHIILATDENISFHKKYSKKAKNALAEMMRIFGF
ncbi:MAG: hypothetical protein FWE22_05290 [Firmicutes bacterium]|nr:hypothetical protein [Bacillota bacterium]